MTWTADQVMSLAPDASSAGAGRKLATPVPWQDLGHASVTTGDAAAGSEGPSPTHGPSPTPGPSPTEEPSPTPGPAAVWGRCKGSGKTPYQTVVDLTGPAYRCSCPSRKFPCKHALGLLLLWTGGHVPAADEVPEFANSWLSSRRQRAARSAKPTTPAHHAAAAQRAERTRQRRAERVADGMAELDRWVCDRVRTGLAGADADGYGFVTTIAARMVDAQAPGVASRLRALPAVFAEPDWPRRLLTELALLRLLATAHARLTDLPAPLADSVRSHIGYPMTTEELRARGSVRDDWAVLSVTDGEQDQLRVRRTLLWGRRTDRPALLLAFAPQGAAPEPGPPVGTTLDAELSFYPGAAPLRAVLGTSHAQATPGVAVAAESLTDGLARCARAVTADPWLTSWPFVISGVTPVRAPEPAASPASTGQGRWSLHDAAGSCVDLTAASPMALWRLLAVSVGRPVTVAGQWSPDGWRVLSVVADGEVTAL